MTYELLTGDCREVLATLPAQSVHCVVTSPPYLGLRDYGTAHWLGGDPDCDHAPGGERRVGRTTLGGGTATTGHQQEAYRQTCGKCGATRVDRQIGLEATPDEYVAKLVAVFREVWRVLRDDGVVWLNLGDSYANSDKGALSGCKEKDLMGIPWRVAFALQAEGWYLRADCIWAKPNPMPESVGDRPTRAHEYIFLLTKQERYFYDSEAIKEPATYRAPGNKTHKHQQGEGVLLGRDHDPNAGLLHMGAALTRNKRSVWTVTPKPYRGAHFAVFPPDLIEPCILAGTSAHGACSVCGAPYERMLETVGRQQQRWAKGAAVVEAQYGTVGKTSVLATAEVAVKETVGWRPTCTCNQEGIAYAPDDLELIETPTGSGDGDDPTLLTGRKGLNRPRNADEGKRTMTRYEQRQYAAQLRTSPHRAEMAAAAGPAFAHYLRTDRSGARPVPASLLDAWQIRGWVQAVPVPSFTPYPIVPCRVLDPFSGSGTTGLVALKHGCDYWGIDLNPAYQALAQERIRKVIG